MRLLALLDDYGPPALATALARDALGAGSIAHQLAMHRRSRAARLGRLPPMVGAQGHGKTMLAKNIVHQVVAGHSSRLITSSDLVGHDVVLSKPTAGRPRRHRRQDRLDVGHPQSDGDSGNRAWLVGAASG